MKILRIWILTLLLALAGCDQSEYREVKQQDLPRVFSMNSSPTFLGYYYEGSDPEFHYFTSRWKYGRDLKLKVPQADLEIPAAFDRGSAEIRLTVLNVSNHGPVFFEIEGRPVYATESIEGE
jgi:hypothetical protein